MSKKWYILLIISIIFMTTGICLLLFPHASNYIYEQQVQKSKDEFIITVSQDKNKIILDELYELLKMQNAKLYATKQSNLIDPFSYEQTTIDLSKYKIDNNTIGYIRIPKMEIELPILLGANSANMKKGAVHLTETSYPIGGNNTNCVIAAHRGYEKATMFRYIDKLEYGDKIYIQNFREELVYEVYEISIINPNDTGDLMIVEGKDIITLITCHPYGHNSQRYVVKAKRI